MYFHLTTFSNICDFIHVLIFVTVSKCRKSPKLTNIVIISQPLDVHGKDLLQKGGKYTTTSNRTHGFLRHET